jgi:hypothetical protein
MLTKLGFRLGSTSGPQKVWEYSEYDALVILPPHRSDEPLPSWHLLGTRRICDAKGIIESEDFDRMLNAIVSVDDCPPVVSGEPVAPIG